MDGIPGIGFALVCLVRWNPRSRDGHQFGYKDMSENMGPCEADCPAAILELLSPTDHEYALDWRARCRANLVLRARKLSDGRSEEHTSELQSLMRISYAFFCLKTKQKHHT